MLSAERLPYTTGVIGGGELLFGGEVTLAGPGEGQNSYDTPWLFGSYGMGLNEIAARFHSYVTLPAPAPVLARPSGDPQHMGSRCTSTTTSIR